MYIYISLYRCLGNNVDTVDIKLVRYQGSFNNMHRSNMYMDMYVLLYIIAKVLKYPRTKPRKTNIYLCR